MTLELWQVVGIVVVLGIVGMYGYRQFKFRKVRMRIPDLIKSGAVVVDVRSRGEFSSGAYPGSLNIPLDELTRGLKKLDPHKPVILCCASGARSARAEQVLRQAGFEQVVNAGSWAALPG